MVPARHEGQVIPAGTAKETQSLPKLSPAGSDDFGTGD